MWSIVLKALAGLGSEWLSNRKEKNKAKHARELAILQGDITADVASSNDMATSLKDEFLVIVLTTPLVVIFYGAVWGDPQTIAQVKMAFEAMSTLPEWYQWSFMGCVAATFGLRSVKALGPKT